MKILTNSDKELLDESSITELKKFPIQPPLQPLFFRTHSNKLCSEKEGRDPVKLNNCPSKAPTAEKAQPHAQLL